MKKLLLVTLLFLFGCDYSNKYDTDDECTKENMAKVIVYHDMHPKSYNKNALNFAKENLLIDFYDTGWRSTTTGAPICYVKYKYSRDASFFHEEFIQYNYTEEHFERGIDCFYKTIEGKKVLKCK